MICDKAVYRQQFAPFEGVIRTESCDYYCNTINNLHAFSVQLCWGILQIIMRIISLKMMHNINFLRQEYGCLAK